MSNIPSSIRNLRLLIGKTAIIKLTDFNQKDKIPLGATTCNERLGGKLCSVLPQLRYRRTLDLRFRGRLSFCRPTTHLVPGLFPILTAMDGIGRNAVFCSAASRRGIVRGAALGNEDPVG